uniref:Variant surface glycoprotein Bug 2 n=1 Tax=Trypanosoma brucei brucei TaxID=5702 RepID=Q571W8_TRYBB|nr:variant surface glycoprotein Bug 2 [Trypanosoma brucei brucei]
MLATAETRQTARLLTLQTAVLAALVIPRSADAAAAHSSSGISGFRAICELINLGAASCQDDQVGAESNDIKEAAALINLTIANPAIITELEAKATPEEAIGTENSKAAQQCTGDNEWICKAAHSRLKQKKGLKTKQTLTELSTKPTLKESIEAVLNQLKTEIASIDNRSGAKQCSEAKKALATAIGVQDTSKDNLALPEATTDRATTCGKPSGTDKGTIAGKNLLADAVCLCSSDAASSNAGDNCNLQTGTGNLDFASAISVSSSDLKKLLGGCSAFKADTKLTAHALEAALSAFDNERFRNQGTNNKITNVIGHVDGTGAECDGSDAGNKGACVYYGKSPGSKALLPPAWREHITAAIGHLQHAEQERLRRHESIKRATTLNTTLAALILIAGDASSSQALREAAQTKQTNIGAQPGGKGAKDCGQHKDNTTCTAHKNCKWEGESDTKGECKPKDGEGQTNPAAGAGTDGKTNTTGSNSFAINKAPLLLAFLLF